MKTLHTHPADEGKRERDDTRFGISVFEKQLPFQSGRLVAAVVRQRFERRHGLGLALRPSLELDLWTLPKLWLLLVVMVPLEEGLLLHLGGRGHRAYRCRGQRRGGRQDRSNQEDERRRGGVGRGAVVSREDVTWTAQSGGGFPLSNRPCDGASPRGHDILRKVVVGSHGGGARRSSAVVRVVLTELA